MVNAQVLGRSWFVAFASLCLATEAGGLDEQPDLEAYGGEPST